MNEIKKLALDKKNTGVQFLKYAFCGGLALVTDALVFFLTAWLLFPALTQNDSLVRIFHLSIVDVPEHIRTINFCINSGIAFLVSNFVAYVLNVIFVFQRGRHGWLMEIGLFYLVSALSVGIGVALGALLIHGFNLSTSFSYVAKVVTTTLINFAARKFIIFKH